MLSGKAKVDFEKWIDSQMYNRFVSDHHIVDLDETCLNALIIEWLDSVGVHIEVTRLETNEPALYWFYSVEGSEINKKPLKTRNQSTYEALEEAIAIYNKK